MREASIVRSVIDIAESEARKHGGLDIRKIKLKVGEFRGVVKEALEFSFARSRKTRGWIWNSPTVSGLPKPHGHLRLAMTND
jgi:hydrogenase/urease nickel incorporation metallochaperone HypA